MLSREHTRRWLSRALRTDGRPSATAIGTRARYQSSRMLRLAPWLAKFPCSSPHTYLLSGEPHHGAARARDLSDRRLREQPPGRKSHMRSSAIFLRPLLLPHASLRRRCKTMGELEEARKSPFLLSLTAFGLGVSRPTPLASPQIPQHVWPPSSCLRLLGRGVSHTSLSARSLEVCRGLGEVCRGILPRPGVRVPDAPSACIGSLTARSRSQ